jgi:transcriptional regulator with XRE-family HTH domain
MGVVHHEAMERDWKRLGKALAEAREAARLTQVQVADRLGVSRTPIQAIERGHTKGKPFTRISGTMRGYARLVGWVDGSIETVLAGGEPTVQAPADPQPQARSAPDEMSGLPLAILDQLRGGGPLIDATVIPLPSTRSDAHMTIVVRGEPDASPEEIRDALLAWRKAQRHLQNLADEELDEGTEVANGA